MRFKVGDRVVCIEVDDTRWWPNILELNRIYTVISVAPIGNIMVNGSGSEWRSKRFIMEKDLTPLHRCLLGLE